MDHELKYRAMSMGLAHLGIPDNSNPHWYCTCGRWVKSRNPRSGSPHRETAVKHHRRHVSEASG